MSSLRRGEIRWYTFKPPNKRRPIVLLTRDDAIDALNEIVAAAVTTSIRDISTQVRLSVDEGVPQPCAINLDHVHLAQRSNIGPLIATLRDERWPEVEHALLVACGFRR